ncbi:hypothetical protein TNCT_400231 [Trichonephila clavata]|uniref:Uncharacterized protein n=1 Tax=Trichonephila clavata TaxID=2740835 RepID=A0A8X6JE62_TRICU|nr:hypothetical protein TNCT_400231 [Trichonephila clavata]
MPAHVRVETSQLHQNFLLLALIIENGKFHAKSFLPCSILWVYGKDHKTLFVLLEPKTIEELEASICIALATVTVQMLQNVCREMEYCLDVASARLK